MPCRGPTNALHYQPIPRRLPPAAAAALRERRWWCALQEVPGARERLILWGTPPQSAWLKEEEGTRAGATGEKRLATNDGRRRPTACRRPSCALSRLRF